MTSLQQKDECSLFYRLHSIFVLHLFGQKFSWIQVSIRTKHIKPQVSYKLMKTRRPTISATLNKLVQIKVFSYMDQMALRRTKERFSLRVNYFLYHTARPFIISAKGVALLLSPPCTPLLVIFLYKPYNPISSFLMERRMISDGNHWTFE